MIPDQLDMQRIAAGRALDEAREAIVVLVKSVAKELSTTEHDDALSELERYAPTEECLGDDFSIQAELLSKFTSLFLFDSDPSISSRGPSRAVLKGIEGYRHLDIVERGNMPASEKLEHYVWATRCAEESIDILVGIGLRATRGKLTLGRSLRRWWSGVIYSK